MSKELFFWQAEWPVNDYVPDENAVRISGRYDQPGLLKIWSMVYVSLYAGAVLLVTDGPRGLIGKLSSIIFWMEGGRSLADNPLGWGIIAGSVAVWLLKKRVWDKLVVRLLGSEIDIRVSAEQIRFKGQHGMVSYQRSGAISFLREDHQRAKEEERRAQGGGAWNSYKYRNSLEVVMRIGEIRVVLAEMDKLDEEKANALVLRLQNTVANINALLQEWQGKGEGQETGKTSEDGAGGNDDWRKDIR